MDCTYYIVSHINLGVSVLSSRLLGLIPSILCEDHGNLLKDFEELVEYYRNDLPSPEIAESEISRWKGRYVNI